MEVAIAAKEATVIRVEDLLAGARQRARTEEAAHAQTLAELQASHRRGERLEAEMRAVAAEASTVRSCFFEEVRKADRSLAAAKEASILAAGQAEAELALCTRGVLGAELAEADAVLHDVTAALASVSKAAADAADRGRAAAQRRAREAESSNGTFTDDSLRVLYRRLKQEATAAIVAAAEDATAQCRVAVAALANEKAANKADRRELELAESRVAAERDRAAAAVNGERDAHKAAAAAATACAAAEARAAEIESRLEQAIEDADGARATISRLVASLASKLDAAVAGEGSLEAMVSGTVAAIDNHQLQSQARQAAVAVQQQHHHDQVERLHADLASLGRRYDYLLIRWRSLEPRPQDIRLVCELRAELRRQVFVTEKAIAQAHTARETLRNAEEAFNRRFVGPGAEPPRTRAHAAVTSSAASTNTHTAAPGAVFFASSSEAHSLPCAAAAHAAACGASGGEGASHPACLAWGVAPDLDALLAPRVEQVATLMAGTPCGGGGLGGASIAFYRPIQPSRSGTAPRQPRSAPAGQSPRPRPATAGAHSSSGNGLGSGGVGSTYQGSGCGIPQGRPFTACARTGATRSEPDPCTEPCCAGPALPFTKPSARGLTSGGHTGRPASARAYADPGAVNEAMARVAVPSGKQPTSPWLVPGHASRHHSRTGASPMEHVHLPGSHRAATFSPPGVRDRARYCHRRPATGGDGDEG